MVAEINSQTHKIQVKFLDFSRRWIQGIIGIMIFFEVIIEIIPDLIAFHLNYLTSIYLFTTILQIVAVIIAYLWAAYHLDTAFGSFIFILMDYVSGSVYFHVFKRMSDFTLAITFWGIIFVFCFIGLILGLIRFCILVLTIPPNTRSILDYFKAQGRAISKGGWISLGLMIMLIGGWSIISQKSFGIPVTISPQSYQIEFRIWANYDPDYYLTRPYGTDILEQLDRHHVTIQNAIFYIRDAQGKEKSFSPTAYPDDINTTVTTLGWFRDNYPNIRFQYYAFGLGFDSCGNYEGSIYTGAMLKRFVNVCRNYSLPNVVGVYTDWEGPLDTAPKNANFTRNGWHQAMWEDAMAYTRAYFPNWTFSCCYPDGPMWDRVDNDADLQYFQRYNVFMPMWDDYGPMIYRSCDMDDDEPEKFDGSWMIYANAKAQLEGALNNELSRATMWLGCTGCGPYNNQTIVYEHGEPLSFGNSKGFDALARDILILKHFRYQTVSLFHGIDQFDNNSAFSGFFHQYGYEDAFDRLNNTVNGPQSTEKFTIWSEGDWSSQDDITLDFLLNYNRIESIPLMIVYGIVGFCSIPRKKNP